MMNIKGWRYTLGLLKPRKTKLKILNPIIEYIITQCKWFILFAKWKFLESARERELWTINYTPSFISWQQSCSRYIVHVSCKRIAMSSAAMIQEQEYKPHVCGSSFQATALLYLFPLNLICIFLSFTLIFSSRHMFIIAYKMPSSRSETTLEKIYVCYLFFPFRNALKISFFQISLNGYDPK